MRMTLARKGLLGHVKAFKDESDVTEAWLINDAKTLGIIGQGVEVSSPNHDSMSYVRYRGMGNAPLFLQPLVASRSCDDDASSSRLQNGEWDKYGGTSRFFRRTGSGTLDYGRTDE